MFRVPLQQNSSRATSLDGNCMCCAGKVQSISKHFHFCSIKFILLFHVIPNSHCSLYSILEYNFVFTYCWIPTYPIATMKHYSCHLIMHILVIHYSIHLIMGQNIIYCDILVQEGVTPATFCILPKDYQFVSSLALHAETFTSKG